MYKFYVIIFCSLTVLLTACRKENGPAALANGSISFQSSADKDTLQTLLSILSDTTLVIRFNAALSGGTTSSSDHWVNFAVDTTKISQYRALYRTAVLLPSSCYFFYKSTTRLSAGALMAEQAQLNIVQETKLTEYTTYVLPIVIQSVDGITDGPASTRVMYYVFKTGKPLFVNKTGWTIAGYSSLLNSFVPANVLDDNNTTTYWATSLTQQLPQWIAINFNKNITFSALNYYVPPLLKYPTLGGYPTSIQIETSSDGTNWVSNGIYSGNIVNNMQTINTGLITASYLRFTVLASVKYSSTYSTIFISGISLVP